MIGSAVAALVPDGTHPAVVWGILIGAEIPDADFVVRIWRGPVLYLRSHRGPTHGVISLAAAAALIATVLRLIWPDVGFGTLFLWTMLGCLSHTGFDIGNDYGTQAFWPLSRRWLAMDLIPIVDLYLLGAVAAGWAVNGLWPGHRHAIFAVVWGLIAIYVAARWWLRRQAWNLVKQHFDLSQPCGEFAPCGDRWAQERLSIHPSLLSLSAWRYVLQMPGEYLVGRVWVFDRRVGMPERARNEYDRIVKASHKSETISIFRSWARRPRVQVENRGGLYHVVWSDMRYEVEGFSPFTAYAWLDEDLKLIDEGLGKDRPPKVDLATFRRRLLYEMGRQAD